MKHLYILIVSLLCIQYVLANYRVKLTDSGPTVTGGAIRFKAELFENEKKADGTFLFEWEYTTSFRHTREKKITGYTDAWRVTYPSTESSPGTYTMTVIVKQYYLYLVPVEIARAVISFDLTSTFSGSIQLEQSNKTIQTHFVSNSTTLKHKIQLSASDMENLNGTATQILTYWFVDCVYYGISNNMEFLMNFTSVDDEHVVEAFVIPNFDPFPTEAPPTTTTTTTTPKPTTTTTKTTTTTTTTTPHPNKTRTRRDVDLITNFDPASKKDIIYKNNSRFTNRTVKYNNSFPFICENHTIVPILPGEPYGYFSRKYVVKDSVREITVSGNNWIQRSEILNLDITCKGSGGFSYCYYFKYGIYNTTGNETCAPGTIYEIPTCNFTIHRYFYDIEKRTAVIIINNDVSTIVSPVAITIYKVNKQAQLSVIVVPVGFSLVAIVLIIFGVAFWVQNRPRYVIEVADFNFGQHYDMEYKTFTERLIESFMNLEHDDSATSSEGEPVWHTGDNNYDSISLSSAHERLADHDDCNAGTS